MFSNQTFRNEAIDLDGKHFVNCKFLGCKLTFSAYEPVKFEGCFFDSCQWVFDGPAENALTFLSALYRGLGTPGSELVEGIFESIRRGGVDPGILLAEPTPALRQ